MFFPVFAASCAGGSSRYGCPAEPGYSCKSVSEVYAEATSGGKSSVESLHESLENKKRIRAARKLIKGKNFRMGWNTPNRTGSEETADTRAGDNKAMPVYFPPPVIHLWIAPWQDSRGVFHSEKYVYVLVGKGRWTIGGKEIPIGAHEEEPLGDIRLRGMRRAP